MKELLEYLRERYSVNEIVELLNDFDEEYLKDYAIDNDICPRCGGDLYLHRWDESRGEHFGFPCKEPMSELKCESCSETY